MSGASRYAIRRRRWRRDDCTRRGWPLNSKSVPSSQPRKGKRRRTAFGLLFVRSKRFGTERKP